MTTKKSTKPEPSKAALKVVKKAAKAAPPEQVTNGGDEPVATFTVAPSPPIKIDNEHAVVAPESRKDEIMAKKSKASLAVEDKGGHAVVAVDVPAHSAEVSVAYSAIEGCAVAAVEAWERVKRDDDASFGAMADSYRRELLSAAEGVYRSGVVMEGDTSLAKFEQAVASIKGKQDEAKAKAAKAA